MYTHAHKYIQPSVHKYYTHTHINTQIYACIKPPVSLMARVPPVREKLFASEDQIHHVVDSTTFFAAEAICVAVLPLRAPQPVDVSVSEPAAPNVALHGGQRQGKDFFQGRPGALRSKRYADGDPACSSCILREAGP